MKKVQEYFTLYPANTECFETSDGTLFHNQYDANLHAKSLDDKDVVTHKASKLAVKEGKKELTDKEKAQAKVDGLTAALAKEKDETKKGKIQTKLDAANDELKAATDKEDSENQ